jgi:hypothetical protein
LQGQPRLIKVIPISGAAIKAFYVWARGGQLAKLNYMDIKKMLDRQQALNKKGTLKDGEIKSLVREWHDSRSEGELNHVAIETEMKTMEKI